MDPNFQKAIEELRAMQEQANERHRVAMAEARAHLATLDEEHRRAMAEADERLRSLGRQQSPDDNEDVRRGSDSSVGSGSTSTSTSTSTSSSAGMGRGSGGRGGRVVFKTHEEEMAEANQRLKDLTARGTIGRGGN
ncbi:hypothetical protein F5Y17DRAFT_442846 [Xylariaceae sp. FL0594]|nr:hypothetical protein F5Y17DRAFT_442846 [Xylariaceae sp. FL0594]